jgi:hypothetical protein
MYDFVKIGHSSCFSARAKPPPSRLRRGPILTKSYIQFSKKFVLLNPLGAGRPEYRIQDSSLVMIHTQTEGLLGA